MNSSPFILADDRWSGSHGIGRFSHEIISRLKNTAVLTQGPPPLYLKNLYWLPYHLFKNKKKYRVYFSPGYLPPLYSAIPFVFTIHDLIPIHNPENRTFLKSFFFNTVIKLATHRAYKIITVSEFSKTQIISWAKIPADKVAVIKNGISAVFTSEGTKHAPGYPYLLYVGNNKAHKNIPRLIQAFARAKIDSAIKLILTCQCTSEFQQLIVENHLQNRLIFSTQLTETQLAEYYRGALGLLFPSLYEGFGLPVVEAMACGIPVITSNVTSLPEVAGNAAIMINPLEKEALTFHIEQIITNDALRKNLIAKGLKQATEYSWDQSAQRVQEILNACF